MNRFFIYLCIMSFYGSISFAEDIGKKEFPLSTGKAVPIGELEAVGTIPGCTATLITQDTVVTAAHCVCADNRRHQCNNRATFTLHNVIPVNSLQRRNISIAGDVHVHPNYDGRHSVVCSGSNSDVAVIHLDTPVYTLARVAPISAEERFNAPSKGNKLTLVGFGLTGKGVRLPNGDWECKDPSKGKMKLTLPVASIDSNGIYFDKKGEHTCGGDSGGPVLNGSTRVVGVASCSNRQNSSHYEPIYPFHEWVFGLNKRAENGICSWRGVGKSGINSHQKGQPWCNSGSLLTALDLDGDRRYSATDAPVIGNARCCNAGKQFTGCSWTPVPRSHQKGSAWCPQGSFITSVDLDGGGSPSDYPVIGSAQCCKVSSRWGECLWVEVGAVRSHQSWSNWCPPNTYLTAFDQDGFSQGHAHDSPIIGRAMCCSIGN
jgi:hypothetical protein